MDRGCGDQGAVGLSEPWLEGEATGELEKTGNLRIT